MTHKAIKRFQMSGIISDDSYMMQTRATCVNTVMYSMRDGGYVPLLDIDPAWSVTMNDAGKYEFLLTIQGVYVGKSKAQKLYGIIGQKEVVMD
jgi:hypothetical protein